MSQDFLLSGLGSESKSPKLKDLLGIWRVVSYRGEGFEEVEEGNLWAFGQTWCLMSDEQAEAELHWLEREACSYTTSKILFSEEGLLARYRLGGNTLHLDYEGGGLDGKNSLCG